ncbi:MAG: hypothetical protein V2A67_01755, partial [Bacteroidota bacterium]
MPRHETVQRIRERINLRLFSTKKTVLSILTWGTLLLSIAALLAIIYYYGFPQTPDSLTVIHITIRISIWFYILKYLIRIFYDFHPGQFIRENRMDTVVFLFMVIEELVFFLFGNELLNSFFSRW